MRGVERLVLGALVEAGAVVGEHDRTGKVAEAKTLHIATGDGVVGQPLQRGSLGRAEACAQRLAVEERLDGGVGHQLRLGAALGETSTSRLRTVAPGQDDAQEDDGNQGNGRKGHELPGRRSLSHTVLSTLPPGHLKKICHQGR